MLFVEKETIDSLGLSKPLILYFTPPHCIVVSSFAQELYLPQHFYPSGMLFFASLFLGFYFLFTSAFNFGPMFTLASDRATRDRSFLMLRTHHEAKIPTTNHI